MNKLRDNKLKYEYSTYLLIKQQDKARNDHFKHVHIDGEFSTTITTMSHLRLNAEYIARRRCAELYPDAIIEDVLRPIVYPKV